MALTDALVLFSMDGYKLV